MLLNLTDRKTAMVLPLTLDRSRLLAIKKKRQLVAPSSWEFPMEN
ncbi:MAG: hypothetical protein OXR67_00235 [Chloroflexota bacterium]|nr:hypothetical protein [Chloroflexota bacterium]